MSSRTAHIFSEIYRFFFASGGLFRNILYNIYVARLSSAESVVRFLLHRPSVKKYFDSNGQDATLFSSLAVNQLLPFFVGTEQTKVLVRFLEVWSVIGCNMKCDYCGAFSPLMKGMVPADEMIHWIETWSKKIVPLNFAFSGGEPLLHPQLELILDAARRCWHSSRIELLSNGLLMPKARLEVFESIRRNKIQVLLTKHFDNPEYNEKFFAGVEKLKQEKIIHSVRRSDQFWFKYYQKNEKGEPIPFQSDPCKAWKQCFAKIGVIQDNELYYCGLLAHMIKTRQAGVIGAEWDITLEHRPMKPDCTRQELIRYMYHGVIKECCVCAEKYEYIVPGEMADAAAAKQ
jgi:organic radical activating enzyme